MSNIYIQLYIYICLFIYLLILFICGVDYLELKYGKQEIVSALQRLNLIRLPTASIENYITLDESHEIESPLREVTDGIIATIVKYSQVWSKFIFCFCTQWILIQ